VFHHADAGFLTLVRRDRILIISRHVHKLLTLKLSNGPKRHINPLIPGSSLILLKARAILEATHHLTGQ